MSDEKTIAERIQDAIDKRRAELTPEQQEKNRKSAENLLQAVSNVWTNKVPTPWAVGAMQNSGQFEELAKAIADRWEKSFAEFSAEEEKKMTAEEIDKEFYKFWNGEENHEGAERVYSYVDRGTARALFAEGWMRAEEREEQQKKGG